MKSQKVGVCLILLLSASLVVAGCSSMGSAHGAYPTLKQTKMNVDWPMTRYRNGVAAGAVTLGERQQVDAAYNNFKKAFDTALEAAHGDDELTTPDNIKALANQVIDAIAAIPF